MNSLLESINILEALVEAKLSLKKKKRTKYKDNHKDKLKDKEYYRRNKSEIKKKSRKFNRSAKGRKWKRLSSTFAKRTKKKGSGV